MSASLSVHKGVPLQGPAPSRPALPRPALPRPAPSNPPGSGSNPEHVQTCSLISTGCPPAGNWCSSEMPFDVFAFFVFGQPKFHFCAICMRTAFNRLGLIFTVSKGLFILKRKRKRRRFQLGSYRIPLNVHIDQRKKFAFAFAFS